MWRAEKGGSADFAAVEQFAHNQPGFDGFADTDVIGDQQPDYRLTQGHQQRYQLVGARFDGDIAERSERAGAVAHFKQQGIAQQHGGIVTAGQGRVWQRKGCRGDRFEFEPGYEGHDIFV